MNKISALLIAFSLMILSGNLMAKERRGAEIKIYKTKPQMEGTLWETPHIRGELIAVKKNSLLLLDSEGTDVSVDIDSIKVIEIEKKSKAVAGLLIGASVGAALGFMMGDDNSGFIRFSATDKAKGYGILFGLLGAIGGGLEGNDEKIKIEGHPDSEIKEILEKLRSKARIPGYR